MKYGLHLIQNSGTESDERAKELDQSEMHQWSGSFAPMEEDLRNVTQSHSMKELQLSESPIAECEI